MYQEGVTEGIPIRVTHLGRVQLCPGVLATGHLQFRLLARHLGTPALGGPCHGPFTCLAPLGPPIQHRGRRGGRWAGTPPPGASACSAGRGQLHPGGSRPALSHPAVLLQDLVSTGRPVQNWLTRVPAVVIALGMPHAPLLTRAGRSTRGQLTLPPGSDAAELAVGSRGGLALRSRAQATLQMDSGPSKRAPEA